MNRVCALIGYVAYSTALTVTAVAGDGQWSVEAGAASVTVDGIRPYAVPANKLRQNDRRQVAAGYVRVARDMGAWWSFGVAYTRYGQLRASGSSSNSDIFDRGGIGLTVIVPLEIAERIQEWSMDGSAHWQLSSRWSLRAGPVVSYFNSKAELNTSAVIGTIGSSNPPQKVYSRIAN